MSTGFGHMAPVRLGWQQDVATCHRGGWDGNKGDWEGNRVWPHGIRVARMATETGHIAPG